MNVSTQIIAVKWNKSERAELDLLLSSIWACSWLALTGFGVTWLVVESEAIIWLIVGSVAVICLVAVLVAIVSLVVDSVDVIWVVDCSTAGNKNSFVSIY